MVKTREARYYVVHSPECKIISNIEAQIFIRKKPLVIDPNLIHGFSIQLNMHKHGGGYYQVVFFVKAPPDKDYYEIAFGPCLGIDNLLVDAKWLPNTIEGWWPTYKTVKANTFILNKKDTLDGFEVSGRVIDDNLNIAYSGYHTVKESLPITHFSVRIVGSHDSVHADFLDAGNIDDPAFTVTCSSDQELLASPVLYDDKKMEIIAPICGGRLLTDFTWETSNLDTAWASPGPAKSVYFVSYRR